MGRSKLHRPLQGGSLRSKVTFILVLVTVLPMLGLGMFTYALGRSQAIASELDHLSEQNQELGALVDKYLASNAQLVRHLAATSEVEEFLRKPARPGPMNSWLHTQRALAPNLDALFLVQPDGLCLASSDPRFLGKSYTFRSYFQDGMAGLSRLTDWQMGLTNRGPAVFIPAPIRPEGRILGLLVLRINMEPVQRMVAEAGNHGREAFLINRDGIILAHSRPDLVYQTLTPLSPARRSELAASRQFMDLPLQALPFDPGFTQAVATCIETDTPARPRYLMDGRARRATLVRLHEEPWASGMAVAEPDILATSHRILVWTLGVAGLSLGLALAVGMAFSRHFLGPLESLAVTMERFGEGESDLRASCQSVDEVGRLACNFNRMAEQISAQTKALENRVENLEGILPICSGCKRIRNEDGAYESVDEYLSTHTRTLITHGICDECAKKLYPKYFPGGSSNGSGGNQN